jgi:hypothetical protein
MTNIDTLLTTISHPLTVLGAAAAVHAIWRQTIRRLTRIVTSAAVVMFAAILFCHPGVLTNPVPHDPPIAPFHQ